MRSRIVITALLTAGVLMATSGEALALTDATNASVEQYGGGGGGKGGGGNGGGGTTSNTLAPTPPAAVTPPATVVTPPPVEQTTPPESSPPEEVPPPEVVQPERQLNENELPFTGFAVIPLLLFGVALLAGGLALRRTMRGRLQSSI